MTSGERIRAGRSPPCSGPPTGSSRTRPISPCLGIRVEGTRRFLLKRVIFLLQFQIDLGHCLAAFNYFHSEFLLLSLLQPAVQYVCNHLASPAGLDRLLKFNQNLRRQRIRALRQPYMSPFRRSDHPVCACASLGASTPLLSVKSRLGSRKLLIVNELRHGRSAVGVVIVSLLSCPLAETIPVEAIS